MYIVLIFTIRLLLPEKYCWRILNLASFSTVLQGSGFLLSTPNRKILVPSWSSMVYVISINLNDFYIISKWLIGATRLDLYLGMSSNILWFNLFFWSNFFNLLVWKQFATLVLSMVALYSSRLMFQHKSMIVVICFKWYIQFSEKFTDYYWLVNVTCYSSDITIFEGNESILFSSKISKKMFAFLGPDFTSIFHVRP